MAHRNIDYTAMTKYGFLLGLTLFGLGIGGEAVGSALLGPLPGWEHTLFLYSEGVGILTGFLSVFIFGIFLPLTE
jgi:hypothetical protein